MQLGFAVDFYRRARAANELPEVIMCILCENVIPPPNDAQAQCGVCGGFFCYICHMTTCEGENPADLGGQQQEGAPALAGQPEPAESAGAGADSAAPSGMQVEEEPAAGFQAEPAEPDAAMTPRGGSSTTDTCDTDSLGGLPSRNRGSP